MTKKDDSKTVDMGQEYLSNILRSRKVMISIAMLSKVPIPGWSKTRLAQTTGEQFATRFQEALLAQHCAWLQRAKMDFELWLGWPDERSQLYTTVPYAGKNVHALMGVDLAQALQQVLKHSQNMKPHGLICIGVDAPHAIAKHLQTALHAMERNRNVLGPTLDGGVYLMGIAPLWLRPFDDVLWGTEHVFSTLLRNALESRLGLQILPLERDLDTEEDVKSLCPYFMSHCDFPILKTFFTT